MRTAIVYQSIHHGNTKKLVDAIAQGHDVDLIDAGAQKQADLGQYDLIGFASGIYGWRFHRNVLEFAAYLSPDGAVLPESLPGDLLCTQKGPPLTLAQRVKEFERREALKAVERHGSTTQGKRAAAAELGISLASLYNKLGSS